MSKDYNADNIKVLEGLKAVRKVPGMYIGSTGKSGLHHLVYEVVDNSVDEALAGYCNEINVTIHEDNSVTLVDDGRGIPVDKHNNSNKSALELVLTKLHAGGKFDEKTYKVSGGLHGVGISVVNALSKYFEAWVHRNGKIWNIKFENGGKITKEFSSIGDTDKTGTIIKFKPDSKIFSDINFEYSVLRSRMRELAFLMPKLKITIKDARTGQSDEFYFEDGIKEFIEELTKNKDKVSPVLGFSDHDEESKVEYDIALKYSDTFNTEIFSFVNNIKTIEGGTHVHGFRSAVSKVIRDKVEEFDKNIPKIRVDDALEGINAVISVRHPNPEFEGQTKSKLGNSDVRSIIYDSFKKNFTEFLDANPDIASPIINKAISAAKARQAAKKAKKLARRKNKLVNMSLPGKLSDCSIEDVTKTELFLVEGDSAGGSAKQARDRDFQAILPLKGKILNVEKSRLNKMLSNDEISSIITAIGAGIGNEFDISDLRYGKIVIMADADVDGAHISCLLLTFFFRYMRELIEEGNIYIAMPPLYQVKKGRKKMYVYSDQEKEKLVKKYESEGKSVSVQRYKGLGEMNPKQLWETTMNPDNRKLKKATIEDAIDADQTFSILMGKDVKPRREFIMDNSDNVENLDI